jgi:hypothetical protein
MGTLQQCPRDGRRMSHAAIRILFDWLVVGQVVTVNSTSGESI